MLVNSSFENFENFENSVSSFDRSCRLYHGSQDDVRIFIVLVLPRRRRSFTARSRGADFLKHPVYQVPLTTRKIAPWIARTVETTVSHIQTRDKGVIVIPLAALRGCSPGHCDSNKRAADVRCRVHGNGNKIEISCPCCKIYSANVK